MMCEPIRAFIEATNDISMQGYGGLPLSELDAEFAEYFLKIIKELVPEVEITSYRIGKTSAEISIKLPKDKRAEFMQKLTDMVREDKVR